MATKLFQNIRDTLQHRWVYLILALLSFIVGIYSIAFVKVSLVILIFLIGSIFILGGLSNAIHALGNKTAKNRVWTFISGLLEFGIGIVLLASPHLSVKIIGLLVGFALLFHGIATVGWSVVLKKSGLKNWSYLAIVGAAGIIISLLFLVLPNFIKFTMAVFVSATSFLFGIGFLLLAFNHKKSSFNNTNSY